jgi:acyl carrier protein
LDVQKVIHDFMLEEFASERRSLSPHENLLVQGVIDSMGILRLVTFLEARFDFKAEDDDMVPENFMTLERLQRFVTRKRGLAA